MPTSDSLVYLFESNSDALYIQLDNGPVWDIGNGVADVGGRFSDDAAAWVAGEWEPSESDGHTRANTDGLTMVAAWSRAGGVQYIHRPDNIGGTQRAYLGIGEAP